MKSFLTFLLLLTVNLPLFAQETEPARPKTTLRVMSYNILNGFDWGRALTRKDSMSNWIREQAPDVIAFQELCGFNKEKLSDWAKGFGHEHSVILKEDGYPVGVSSRFPIRVKGIFPGGKLRGFLHVETGGVEFIVVHLNPSDLQIRRQESEMMRAYIRSVSADTTSKFLVLGDFNAHSPMDVSFDKKYPAILKRTALGEEANPGKPGNLLEGRFDYSVMSNFLSIPLVDVIDPLIAEDQKRTFPTPILTGRYYKPAEMKECKERIDYILASPRLASKCSQAFIFNSGMPDMLSDHYPIMAVFTL